MKQETKKLTIDAVKQIKGGLPVKTNIKAGTIKFQPETTRG
jgi:hypothetical protein